MTRASAWSLNAVPEVEKSESERHLKDSKSAGLINTLGWSVVVWSCHVSKVSKCVNSFRQRSAWLDRFTESPRRSHAEHAFSVGVPSWVAEPSASLWTWKKNRLNSFNIKMPRCNTDQTGFRRFKMQEFIKIMNQSWTIIIYHHRIINVFIHLFPCLHSTRSGSSRGIGCGTGGKTCCPKQQVHASPK